MKRSHRDIIYDMLKITLNKNNRIRKTQLMSKANMSHKQLTNYLNELFKNRMISFSEDGKYISVFEPRGFRYINEYERFMKYLNEQD